MYIHDFNFILVTNLPIVKITKNKQSNCYGKKKLIVKYTHYTYMLRIIM